MKVKQYITHGLLSIPNDWFQAYLNLTQNKNADTDRNWSHNLLVASWPPGQCKMINVLNIAQS